MNRNPNNIGVHPKSRKKFILEYYLDDENLLPKKPLTVKIPKIHKKPPIHKEDKAVVQTNARVYNRNNGYTAVIKKITDDKIKIKYDFDDHETIYYRKNWTIDIPFLGIGRFPIVIGKFRNLKSMVGIRFDNYVNPQYGQVILRHCPLRMKDEGTYILRRISLENKDRKIKASPKFELIVETSETISKNNYWEHFFSKVMNIARAEGINYLTIPWDFASKDELQVIDICKIGLESVLKWIVKNPEYNVRVGFSCASVYLYKKFLKVMKDHQANPCITFV